MGSKHNLLQDKKPEISLFEGDDGFCIRRILAREPSLNQSIDSFYRESEGIPFKWEIQPGTPKEYPQQDGLISTPPLSPSPLMQSLKLRPPDHDDIKGLTYTSSKMKSFKKMVQKSVAFNRDKVQTYGVWRGDRPKESLRFGEYMKSVKDSSASTSYSSFSVSWRDRGLDSSRDSMFDPGSCCRNGDVAGIVLQDEENKGIALIPKEEMQPGTTKHPRGNEVIQPPRAVHSSYLPPPQLHDGGEKDRDSAWTKKACRLWIKGSRERRKTKKFDQEISFRCPKNMEICDHHSVQEFHDSEASVASESNANFETLTMKRASYFSCGSWKGMKRDSCVCSKQI